MGKIEKDKIIRSMTDKEVYGIEYDFAVKAVENINFIRCHKYSMYHYQVIYTIIKNKLDTMSDKGAKLAYLNCLCVNYTSFTKTEFLDVIISLLTGGFVGVSFIDKANDIIYKIAAIISAIILVCLKIYVLTTKKWDFYNKIFEHLKNNIE